MSQHTHVRPASHHSHARPATPVTSAGPAKRRWAVPGVIAAAIVGVQVLFVFCLGYPLLHASPHEVPIGVAGPPSAVRLVDAALARQPGAFDVHAYPDAAAARAAIRDRDVYGALVATPGGPELLVASAASPQIAAALTSKARSFGRGHAVPVTDVVPAPRKDPNETGALTTLLPLILISVALGTVLSLTERRGWRVFGWCAGASVVAGLAVSGVASGLGTFTGHYWADAGVLAMLVFGISACSAALITDRPLRPLHFLFALTMIFIGIPSAGALVPPELLAQPWRAMGPDLPPAAALSALRGITFFHGAAIGRPLTVLACWAAFGVLLACSAGLYATRTARRARTGRGGRTGPLSVPGAAGLSTLMGDAPSSQVPRPANQAANAPVRS
jgi:hypothetical protein